MFYLKKNPWIVRQVESAQKEIFLTFDDGPDADFTAQVLDLLSSEKWKASFFVVGQKAQAQKNLIDRMIQEGHAVMSHSVDHGYFHYFKGKTHLKNWLQDSLKDLSQITNLPQKAFRPPAGVLTPPLLRAAEELQIPLVMWKHRFFDTSSPLTMNKIDKNLAQIKAGDIVLLHDRQADKNKKVFISSLRQYVQKMKKNGYIGGSLTNELLLKETRQETPKCQ